jgi:ABC-type phosphate transport system ATPase subunit
MSAGGTAQAPAATQTSAACPAIRAVKVSVRYLLESGPTEQIFTSPRSPVTSAYIQGLRG